VLIDTHCHLDDPPLAGDVASVLERAAAAGVGRVLVPGTDPARWDALARLRDEWPGQIAIAVGLHPQRLPALDDAAVDEACRALSTRAAALSAVAIGECGFDGPTAREGGVALARQAEVVAAHCDVGDALRLPLIVHVRDATGFALAFFEARGPLRHGGVLHGFGGPAELVPRWAALGFSFGIGPAITWPRARRPRDAARAVPLERLLLETDAPDTYVAGAWARTGEPSQVREVLRALAALRGEGEVDLGSCTTQNAIRLLGARG
jgi:TatD DNase family protein